MNIEDILDILVALLLLISGGLHIFRSQWFFKDLPSEAQASNQKLLRIMFGPAFIVLGVVLLVFQFV